MERQAVIKLQNEMDQHSANPYVQAVGTMLQQCNMEVSAEALEDILSGKKTLLGSLEAMRKVAEGKKVGNCAVLTDAEGFDIVRRYFGIVGEDLPTITVPVPVQTMPVHPVPAQKPSTDFNVSLDDLLEDL